MSYDSNPLETYDPQCECANAKSEGHPLGSAVPRKRILAPAICRSRATEDHC